MLFTRTPSLRWTPAIARVNPMRADFAASYAAQRGHETKAWTEEMLIIEPPRRRISGMEYLEKRNTPLRLTANWRSHCSADKSTTVPLISIPALLIKT